MLNVIMLRVIMLTVIMVIVIMPDCHNAECHYSECHYAECHSAMWNYTNFVSRLSAIMLNVIMVSAVAPCIIILNLCLG
jgi:hypothetical protein